MLRLGASWAILQTCVPLCPDTKIVANTSGKNEFKSASEEDFAEGMKELHS
jgi:hypothetical protein